MAAVNQTTIVFSSRAYTVDFTMVKSTFFNRIKGTEFKCDDKHHDAFVAINDDEGMSELLERLYASNWTFDEKITTFKQLKQSFEYFEETESYKDFVSCIDAEEQRLYIERANNYVTSMMDKHTQLLIANVSTIFTEELCTKYADRIDFSNVIFYDVDHQLSDEFMYKHFAKSIVAQSLISNNYYPFEKLVEFNPNLETVKFILSHTAYYRKAEEYFKLSPSSDVLQNKYISTEYILANYARIFAYYNKSHYNYKHNTFPNKCVSDVILAETLRNNSFAKWKNISVEYLPIEYIKKYTASLNFYRANYNKEITTEVLDDLTLTADQICQLANCSKLSMAFIRKYLANKKYSVLFEPNNKNLTIDFIISIANNIDLVSLRTYPMTDDEAVRFYTIHNLKRQTAITFMINESISYACAKQMFNAAFGTKWANAKSLQYINTISEITRYEFIYDNIHVVHLFNRIPLKIYEEFKLVSMLERIHEKNDSLVLQLIQ